MFPGWAVRKGYYYQGTKEQNDGEQKEVKAVIRLLVSGY